VAGGGRTEQTSDFVHGPIELAAFLIAREGVDADGEKAGKE